MSKLLQTISCDLLTSALDQIAEGIVITDATAIDNPIIYVNNAFTKMTGYEKSEVIGKNCRFLNEGVRNQPQLAELKAAIKEGRQFVTKLINRRKDGTTFVNSLTMSPVFDDKGELISFAGVQSDVSNQIELNNRLKHQERLATLGEISASVAHEINNPLAIVIGSLKKIRNTISEHDPEMFGLGKWLDRVELSSDRIRNIVKGMREYAYADQLVQEEKSTYCLREAIEQTIFLIKDHYRGLGLSLAFESTVDQAKVLGNRGLFHQALMNLLANAKDALENTPAPRIAIKLDSFPGQGFKVSVSDNGPGIPESIRDKVFDRFYTTKPIGKGTGLGFSIVKEAVEAHSGTLSLGHPEIGASIEIMIPGSVPESMSIKANRALIVDDEEDIRIILADYIESADMPSDQAEDGLQALELIKSNQYSHIFIDIFMPKLNGQELIREIREIKPDECPKLIVISAFLSLDKDCELMVDTFVEKPFSESDIIHALKV